mgnify:CR=1 FL=1
MALEEEPKNLFLKKREQKKEQKGEEKQKEEEPEDEDNVEEIQCAHH